MEYSREDVCCTWLSWGRLSPGKINAIFAEYGTADNFYKEYVETGGRCLEHFGITDNFNLRQLRSHSTPEAMEKTMDAMEKNNVGITVRSSPDFPEKLRDIPDAPWVLFYRGNIRCVAGRCVTIVGSRQASEHGIRAAGELAEDLSNAGTVIISGLAGGIDSAAHRGCMRGASPTCAVLAGGLDTVYPTSNKELAEEMVKTGGLLLSEHPVTETARKWDFPYRNRLISGLGDGVAVVECGIRSGTMRTVEHALNQGKTVFAYPGIPGKVESEGAHQLIREGAVYFTKASDILEDLDWSDASSAMVAKKRRAAEQEEKAPHTDAKKLEKPEKKPLTDDELFRDLTPFERKIMEALTEGKELSFDQLCEKTGADAAQMGMELSMLEINGMIDPMPGKIYRRSEELGG